MTAPARLDILTFGCRLNSYESEVMRKAAATAGLENAVIINTCAVTAEAVRQARQSIRRLRKERPGAHIIVTGCAAQVEPETFARMPEVDRVLGNAQKLDAAHYADWSAPRVDVMDIMTLEGEEPHAIEAMEGRARAYVQVQNGCDHRCTFCIIPFGRGPSRSIPSGAVIEQVRRLTDNGYREIVLTGVDLTAYGADLPARPTLGRLVQQILHHVPDLPRLRLSSLDAVEIDEALFEAIAYEPRVMPHVHLSLQAGDDMILKRMKRRHARTDAVALSHRLRAARPDIALGADIIAGFPTETEAMFENSMKLIDDCDLVHLHVFPFSPRAGTPAAKMPQLDGRTIRDRAARLRDKGAEALDRHLARQTGRILEVLMESDGRARAPDYAQVLIDCPAPQGDIVRARIIASDGRRLKALPA
ncbi:MAG: tRNA (N(6)-L-threonylcarbamoyladenosine(37)-C(2))-methylthiotransferase MtaB [Alphaproteobacteria bacterium]|nr:tRNA (N(6)-L-threonylcarbamoyladenosine(37)-C(2))-methylthiotransferase MtaB [Alphaproteobacteria bacterium]